MHWIMYHAIVLAMAFTTRHADAIPHDTVYSAWTDTGIHLIMSDNGTPDIFDDDVVIDWEDNRNFTVKVYD